MQQNGRCLFVYRDVDRRADARQRFRTPDEDAIWCGVKVGSFAAIHHTAALVRTAGGGSGWVIVGKDVVPIR